MVQPASSLPQFPFGGFGLMDPIVGGLIEAEAKTEIVVEDTPVQEFSMLNNLIENVSPALLQELAVDPAGEIDGSIAAIETDFGNNTHE